MRYTERTMRYRTTRLLARPVRNRVSLLLSEPLKEALRDAARTQGLSMNEFVSRAVVDALQDLKMEPKE